MYGWMYRYSLYMHFKFSVFLKIIKIKCLVVKRKKNNIVSLSLIVLTRKIIYLRFLAAVLLLCYFLVPGTLKNHVLFLTVGKPVMYSMRDSLRPKPIMTTWVQFLNPRATMSNSHPFFVKYFWSVCSWYILLSSKSIIYWVPSLYVGLCATYTRQGFPQRKWKWNSDGHDSWDNNKATQGVQTWLAIRSPLEASAEGSVW